MRSARPTASGIPTATAPNDHLDRGDSLLGRGPDMRASSDAAARSNEFGPGSGSPVTVRSASSIGSNSLIPDLLFL